MTLDAPPPERDRQGPRQGPRGDRDGCPRWLTSASSRARTPTRSATPARFPIGADSWWTTGSSSSGPSKTGRWGRTPCDPSGGGPVPTASEPLEPLSLDQVLLALDVTRVDDRHPLLAVGSNAAPAQIRSKFDRFGITTALPMLRCTVDGWRRTVLAHVSIPGYLPITIEADPRARSLSVSLLLCDDEQLGAIDATEPNYRRLTAADSEPLTLDSGERLCGYLVYVGVRGSVRAQDGSIIDFTTQEHAIAAVHSLLSDELRAECGPDARSFVAGDRRKRCAAGSHPRPPRDVRRPRNRRRSPRTRRPTPTYAGRGDAPRRTARSDRPRSDDECSAGAEENGPVGALVGGHVRHRHRPPRLPRSTTAPESDNNDVTRPEPDPFVDERDTSPAGTDNDATVLDFTDQNDTRQAPDTDPTTVGVTCWVVNDGCVDTPRATNGNTVSTPRYAANVSTPFWSADDTDTVEPASLADATFHQSVVWWSASTARFGLHPTGSRAGHRRRRRPAREPGQQHVVRHHRRRDRHRPRRRVRVGRRRRPHRGDRRGGRGRDDHVRGHGAGRSVVIGDDQRHQHTCRTRRSRGSVPSPSTVRCHHRSSRTSRRPDRRNRTTSQR